MAFQGFQKAVNFLPRPSSWILCSRPRISKTFLAAFICSKKFMDPTIVKPAPWPYETKKFTFLKGYYEGTLKRFDENTHIICVDGNIASGKTTFAKELAEEFGMLYIPEPTMDKFFINDYGYDLRLIDPIVPPSYQSCEIKTFYENPYHHNVTRMQFRMFALRYRQYIDVLAHILNTGQGIVMDRNVYGDFIFMEAMHSCGYVQTDAYNLYNEVKENCLVELFRPTLIVYLDISVDTALERIKKRNRPHEVHSKVLNEEYLGIMEHNYKHRYLKDLECHAELLIYDWSNFGDIEVVVEDIERIDFDRFGKYDEKISDWRNKDDWEWNYFRRVFTNDVPLLYKNLSVFRPRVKNVYHPPEEAEEYAEILKKVPGERYSPGFNRDIGDNIWFKSSHKGYRNFVFGRV